MNAPEQFDLRSGNGLGYTPKSNVKADPPILDTCNVLDRQALWIAHGKRCSYCREALDFIALEVEHIIPVNLRGKAEELAQCLDALGIARNYDLDSIENLLPTHGHCNREKRGVVRDAGFLRHFREVANDRAAKFADIRMRLLKQRDVGQAIASVIHHVEEGIVNLEDVYDLGSGSKPFDLSEDFQEDGFVRLTSPRVRIECWLPTEASPAGSALISFKPVELRGAQFELNHNVLTRELFRGLGAPAKPKVRPFILEPQDGQQTYDVHFGSGIFKMEKEELFQLCQLVDRLAPMYAEAFHRVEIAFEGLNASLLSPGTYEVLELPLAVWREVYDFAHEHDLSNGNSNWHIFDAQTGAGLKIVERSKVDDSWEYCCFLNAEAKRPSADMRSDTSTRISFRWEFESNRRHCEATMNGSRWSVKKAARFLREELIPKVGKRKRWLRKMRSDFQCDEDSPWRGPVGRRQLSESDFASSESAARTIDAMQSLYIEEHSEFVHAEVIYNAYELLSHLLENHELPRWSVEYIRIKLGCHLEEIELTPVESVRESLRYLRTLDCANDLGFLSGDTVDHCLRAVGEVLQNGRANSEVFSQWPRWIKRFAPVWRDYNERAYWTRIRAEYDRSGAH